MLSLGEHHIDTMDYLHSIYINAGRPDMNADEKLHLIRESAGEAIDKDDKFNEENA